MAMKYLCLDIGNVICHISFIKFKDKLSNKLNISESQVEYFLNRTQKLHDLGLTNISDELRDHFKIKSDSLVKELMIEWDNTIDMDEYMLLFLQKISKEEDMKIALLSNIGIEHTKLIPTLLTKPVFDKCVKFYSCDVGARKPSFLYYKTFLDMYPEFNSSIYVDDRIENVETGTRFGLKSIQFSLEKCSSELDKSNEVQKIAKLLDI